jgi:hypothetical protein
MPSLSFTSHATSSDPFVHVDERALILCDGRSTVMFEKARRRWVADTLRVLVDERRATRAQGDRTLGGFIVADTVTLYAFAGSGIGVSLTLHIETLQELRRALAEH